MAKTKKKVALSADDRMETAKGMCFVLMPFGGWFDKYYDEVYRPAIEAAGLAAFRADDIYRPGKIVEDIWVRIRSAQMLIADLTGRNPNVFYELGLAHAIAKPVILITDSIDEVPFDLRALRLVSYDRQEPGWGQSLQYKITRAIKEVVDDPLKSVIPEFLKVDDGLEPQRITNLDKAILELRRDVDLLRMQSLPHNRHDLGSEKSDYDEYRFQIKRYLKANIVRSDIVRRLIARGAPLDWVKDEIERIKEQGVD